MIRTPFSIAAAPPRALPMALREWPAAGITAAYLTVMAVPLALTVTSTAVADRAVPVFLLLHVGLLGVMWYAMLRGAGGWTLAAEFLPLAAIPFLYAELPYLMAAFGGGFHDAIVQRWELATWGRMPARTLAGAMPTAWVSEPLHAAYFSYYAIIYAPLAYLLAAGRRDAFRESAAAVMATFAICFAVFVVFPVQGPRYLWPAPDGVPAGPMRTIVLAVLERGSSRGAAFPSSHMAVAVVQALMAYRWRVPGAWLIALATALLGVGAVYGGFHYGIDMIAGAVLGVAVPVAFGWRYSGWRILAAPLGQVELVPSSRPSAPRTSARAVARSPRSSAPASSTTREG